jgi:hypothetical protein
VSDVPFAEQFWQTFLSPALRYEADGEDNDGSQKQKLLVRSMGDSTPWEFSCGQDKSDRVKSAGPDGKITKSLSIGRGGYDWI